MLLDQADKASSLKMIVKLDGSITEEERQRSTQTGLSLYTMEEVEVRVNYYCCTGYLVHNMTMLELV